MVEASWGKIVLETLSWKNPSKKELESGSRHRQWVQTPIL
jgi:hypothetical protein